MKNILQHAYNPVDWYPWGEEAFQRAEAEGKPIFLSIGYSTCHWCHVMEEESFENHDIAALLNENFISIKVDREERPDVDQIYMFATQAMLHEDYSRYLPNTMIILADGDENQDFLKNSLPFLENVTSLEGKPTAYVCEELQFGVKGKLSLLLNSYENHLVLIKGSFDIPYFSSL